MDLVQEMFTILLGYTLHQDFLLRVLAPRPVKSSRPDKGLQVYIKCFYLLTLIPSFPLQPPHPQLLTSRDPRGHAFV